MNKFEIMDNVGRKMFINHFNKYIKYVELTEEFCQHDINITGNTGIRSYVEIKTCGKQKLIEDYSGSTIINQSKLNHFRQVLADQPARQCLFARYYTDGIILFDISSRIRLNEQLDKRSIHVGVNTVYDNNQTKKDVDIAYLSCNKKFNDKIYRYVNKNNNIILKQIF